MERVREILAAELTEDVPSMSTLWRWSDKYGWPAKRDAIAQALADIKADTILARSVMLKELISSRDAQTGFAVASLEGLALKQAEAARAGQMIQAQLEAPAKRFETKAEAAEVLQQAVELRLATMLADPSKVNLKAVKEIQDALGLIETMKPKGPTSQTGKEGLSGDTVRQIKEFLGYA